MKRLLKYFFVVLLAVVFYAAGFVVPWDLGPKGTVSIADADHKPGHKTKPPKPCKKKKCPPTVSELPIQYMVLSGAVVITLTGGIVFYLRKRKMKSSLEA